MKIAVVGSREFKDVKLVNYIVSWEFNISTNNIFVSGGAKGADIIAEIYIDFNRQNNKIKNLYVCKNRSEHKKLHCSLNKISEELFRNKKIVFKNNKYVLLGGI